MNPCGHLLTLCILFAFQIVFCNVVAQRKNTLSRPNGHDEIYGGQPTTEKQSPPQFECGHRVVKVFLKHADVVNLRIRGLDGDLLHLGQLAPFCGVSIKTSRTDVHLLFSHDSCYVKKEGTEYALSLSWYGTPHILSCPVSVTPPSVVCKNNSMEMTIVGNGTADELSVAINGEWVPLPYAATECWHRERSKPGEITFSVPYTSCGVNVRDGHFILDLKSKDKMIPLSCPCEPKDTGLSETTQPLPQKPPTVPNQIMKQEQAFPVEQQERNVDRSSSPHPRDHWLPKLPSLPRSFNLAANFPFSLPIPTQLVPSRDPLTSKPMAPTPALSPAPTPAPVFSPTQQIAPNVQNQQPHHEMKLELADLVTKAPKSQHHYMKYPYRFQKPASSPQFEPFLDLKSQFPVPSTSLPFGSAQNYNFPRPNPLQVNAYLASLAQYLPPGYFICSYNQQPPVLPEMFHPPVPNPAQPLQYQNLHYQKSDITQPAHANPAVPPMNSYSQQQPTSVVASGPHDSGTQPSQHHPYFDQSSYGHQGTTPLSPDSPLIPINLQSQTSRYPSYPALQDARPFHPEKPSGSVQQPWPGSHLHVTGLSQESKLLAQASSHTSEYLKYQTGGDQSLDLIQWPVPSLPAPGNITGNNPVISLPQPMPHLARFVPYRQGPLLRGMRNPHVRSDKPS